MIYLKIEKKRIINIPKPDQFQMNNLLFLNNEKNYSATELLNLSKNGVIFKLDNVCLLSSIDYLKKRISGIYFANNITEENFNFHYDILYEKAKNANNSLYAEELKLNKNKKIKRYSFISEWQKIFNAWLENKIAHPFIVSLIQQDFIPEYLSEQLIKETETLLS